MSRGLLNSIKKMDVAAFTTLRKPKHCFISSLFITLESGFLFLFFFFFSCLLITESGFTFKILGKRRYDNSVADN